MALVLSCIIAWIVAAYLFTTIQKNEIIRSIIICFIYTIISISSFEIIGLNLHLVDISQDRVKFLSFLINRNITAPLLVAVFVNLFYRVTVYKKIITIGLLLILLTLLGIIDLKFQLYSYVKWNFGLTFLLISFFVFIIMIISKFINVIQMRSEHI